jgi:hypothetical protein
MSSRSLFFVSCLVEFFERLDVCELVFHLEVAFLESADVTDDVAHSSGKCFPLLLLAFAPVVLPKVLVRAEVWHVVSCDGVEAETCADNEVR